MDYRVISIGTLAAHPLWGEGHTGEVRTGHATTTLISADGAHILIDPSLPPAALLARLGERTAIGSDEITHVFLTSADALHSRAMSAFPRASWLAHETELADNAADVKAKLAEAGRTGDGRLAAVLATRLEILGRCRPAPDRIAGGVDLFPLPGVTRGCCGLVLSPPDATVLVCGDAVATREHLEQGKVLPACYDVEQARESFAEAVQIADLMILGRDNLTPNPIRRRFGL